MVESQKWWEHYYVRYFVGTAVAIPLLLLLAQFEPLASHARLIPRNESWLTASAIGLGGLAYCYVSSAPILLLHASRHLLLRAENVYRVSVFCITALCVALTCALFWDGVTELEPSRLNLLPYGLVVASQCALLLRGVIRNARNQPVIAPSQPNVAHATLALESQRAFYTHLARSRVNANPDKQAQVSDYVESYRHLREHGNAILIVFSEVILTLALMWAKSIPQLILLISLWLLPSAIVWLLATWLEASVDAVAP